MIYIQTLLYQHRAGIPLIIGIIFAIARRMKSVFSFAFFLPVLTAISFGQDQDRRSNATHSREDYHGTGSYTPPPPNTTPQGSLYITQRRNDGTQSAHPALPTIFPPAPPVLGSSIPLRQPVPELELTGALHQLRFHVFDSFYAPLSVLLQSGDLPTERSSELDAYRAARQQLVTDLRASLKLALPLPAADRARELSALANRQVASLELLDLSAEKIHLALMRHVSVLHAIEWDNLRQQRGRHNADSVIRDEFNLCFSAALFHEGLSIDQRLLLREAALEIMPRQTTVEDLGVIYFSPFTSRIRLPAATTPEIDAKVGAYLAKKSALKLQLRDELRAHDLNFFTATRTTALKALAARQAPEFAALETLAEEIRVALAALPASEPPAAPALPETLARRLSAYLVAKTDWQKSMLRQVAAWRAKLPGLRIELAGLESVPHIEFKAGPSGANPGAADLAALAEFNRLQQAVYETLGRDKETLTAEIGRTLGTATGGEKSVDQLIAEFGTALGRLDTRLRYRDYETAVLQPGLSPAQRRLLFSAALEQLDLTLLAR